MQFVGLELGTATGPEEYAMSLACAPTRDYLEFGARVSATPWKRAFAGLKPGDEVEVDGPYGHFVLDETRPAVLLAGGIGITPLKGMAEYAADRGLPLDVTLVYSNRSEAEIAYREELAELAEKNPRFRILHTLTRPSGGSQWKGRVGRIDEGLVREATAGQEDAAYYVCGKPEMVADMVGLLRSLGVSRGRVLFEQFWGYE